MASTSGSPDFQDIFEQTPGLCLVVDPQFVVIAVNNAYLTATLSQRTDFLGRNLFVDVLPDVPDNPHIAGVKKLRASMQRVLDTRKPDVLPEERYDIFKPAEQGGGREERYWVTTNIPVLDDAGKITHIIHSVVDVTRRHDAEEQLENFFNLSLDLHCIAGVDGYFKRLNPAWEKALGYSVEELLAKPYLDFIHPDDRSATSDIAVSVERGIPLYNFSNRYICKDGTVRWLLWKATISADRQYHYASARDITDQKAAEEQIKSLNERLQRQNSLLNATNKELEAFSYSVSHDLRAPLRSIDGFSQAVLEDYSGKLDESGQNYLQRIRAATQRMGRLIDDILNLARMSRTEMQPEQIDISRIAQRIVQELRSAEPDRSVEVIVQPNLTARADPRLMEIVLTNLLGNAWKFTSRRSNARIEFGREKIDDAPGEAFFVRDNGAGFDMAYSGKLFGAFQRMHAASDFPGTGVGLALVQRIIHRHGGRVWASSQVDAGATFYFTLA